VLGEKLVKDFPDGVSVAFYADGLDEAQRRATDLGRRPRRRSSQEERVIAVAKDIVFGKAISDKLTSGRHHSRPISAGTDCRRGEGDPSRRNRARQPSEDQEPRHLLRTVLPAGAVFPPVSLAAQQRPRSNRSPPVVTPDIERPAVHLQFRPIPVRGLKLDQGPGGKAAGTGSLGSEIRDAMVTEKIDKGTVWRSYHHRPHLAQFRPAEVLR
jgi:hypothetical protein